VLADSVRPVTADASPLLEAEELLPGSHAYDGVVKLAGEIVFIHDLDRFLTAEEFTNLQTELASS
jgi:hypothetical protein